GSSSTSSQLKMLNAPERIRAFELKKVLPVLINQPMRKTGMDPAIHKRLRGWAMKSKKLFEIAMLFMALLWLIPTAYSQARIGTVQGTVKDPTGALVSSAEVTISQPVTRYSQK